MISKEEIQTARNYPITDLAARLGIELNGTKAVCFAHKEDTASLSFHKGMNIYKCFGCGVAGDTISLVRAVRKCGFNDAVRFITGGKSFPVINIVVEQKKRNVDNSEEIRLITTCVSGNVLGSPYLEKRGIKRDTYEYFGVKENPVYDGKPLRDNYQIFFPFRDSMGRLETYQLRTINKDVKPKYILPSGGVGTIIWNVSIIKNSDNIYLCEGVIDALSCYELGFAPAVAVCGVNNFKKEYYELFKGKVVFVCSDNDEAGNKFYDTLSKHDGTEWIRFKHDPRDKDMNDRLMRLRGLK